MEASPHHNTLQIIQNYVKAPSIEVSPPKTIKMEDITATTAPSTSLLDVPSIDSSSKESRTTKKRKSWGQVLPEPKTNLPPRKRAKTADEKEQRRIERVKRNRLAAHNSRERKRQEVEALQTRNDQLEAHIKLMQQQIDSYRAQCPDVQVPAVPKLERMEMDFEISSPAPCPPCPNYTTPTNIAQFITEMPTPAPFSSPDSLLSTIDSPADTAPSTPVSVGFFAPINLGGNDNNNNGKLHLGASFDHSVQLHDLQDDGDAFIDFALYPEDSISFFNESFDGSANRDGLTGGDSSNALELFDADNLFDLQPGAGALPRSSDAPCIATE